MNTSNNTPPVTFYYNGIGVIVINGVYITPAMPVGLFHDWPEIKKTIEKLTTNAK